MRNISALRSQLLELSRAAESRDWGALLNSRKLEELEFHNHDRDAQEIATLSGKEAARRKGNKRYYSTVQLSQDYVEGWLARHTPGSVFLDYACGNGRQAIGAARAAAALAVGIDISGVSVRNARALAAEEGLSETCIFLQADCENTGLPDASIDTVLCSGMLHHLDLSYAFPELRRILRPGGRILGVEALSYNPLIKAYRLLTPAMRTEWEKRHILSLADVRFASRFFEIGEVRFWHLLAPTAAFFRGASLRTGALTVLNAADNVLTRLPGIRLLSWQFTFEMIRRDDD